MARLRLVMLIECLLSLYIVSRHLSQPQPSLGRSHISGIRVGRNSEHDEERGDPGLLLWGACAFTEALF